MTQMQGIVSILRSDNPEKATKAASLRRTLSADMSSKWLADNGLPVMNKIASSEHIAIDSDEGECEVNGKGDQNPTRVDIWTAIMSQKKQDDSGKLPPPYVHPLVKKSRSLSEKSLKICTESLGSETGSDVFSATPASSEKAGSESGLDVFSTSSPLASEKADGDEQEEKEEHKVVKSTCLTTKKAQQTRSFPPPLPSLAAARSDGPSLHMHSHRVDGRLVVEAVSVQQQKYFEAQRQDGRFLLTLVNEPKEHKQPAESYNSKPVVVDSHMRGVQDVSGQFGPDTHILTLQFPKNQFSQLRPLTSKSHDNNIHETDEDEIETDFSDNDFGIFKFQPLNPKTAMINIPKSTVTIKRILDRDNENPTWSRKLELVEEEDAPIKQYPPPPRTRANGLPPLPPPTTTTTVNSYQYFWRVKPTVASVIDPMITQHRPPTKTKDLVLLRGNKADCFLPSLKGCKEPRRSLLMWEPFCIAT